MVSVTLHCSDMVSAVKLRGNHACKKLTEHLIATVKIRTDGRCGQLDLLLLLSHACAVEAELASALNCITLTLRLDQLLLSVFVRSMQHKTR